MQIYSLLVQALRPLTAEHGVEVRHLGATARLSRPLSEGLAVLLEESQGRSRHTLTLALDHGGRGDLRRIASVIAQRPAAFLEMVEAAPDLVIRTAGEVRLSGFMPAASSFSELYFTDVTYPDLSPDHLGEALRVFAQREQRFGR